MGNPFKWFWYTATLKTKAVIVAFVLLLIAVAVLWSCRDTRPAIEDDNAYKALQGENNVLREQNVQLRASAAQHEAKAQALELERDGLRAELERFGKIAADGVQKQKEAAEQYEKDMAIIDVDISQLERCHRYCANRAELGYACKPNADAYCQKHYGGR